MKRKSKHQTMKKIQMLVSLGNHDPEVIGKKLGLKKETIEVYAYQAGIKYSTKDRDYTLKAIKKALERKVCEEKIAESMNLALTTVKEYRRVYLNNL